MKPLLDADKNRRLIDTDKADRLPSGKDQDAHLPESSLPRISRALRQLAKSQLASARLLKVRGDEFSMHILSELDPWQRYVLLIATDFGVAVCSAKLVVHLLRLV